MDKWLTLLLEKGGPTGATLVVLGVGARWVFARLEAMQMAYLQSMEKTQERHAAEEDRLQERLDQERQQRLDDRERHTEVLRQLSDKFATAMQERRPNR